MQSKTLFPIHADRRRLTWLFALALLSAGTPPAQAQDLTRSERGAGGPMLGGALEDICRGAGGPSSQLCTSYLRGSFEGLMIGQASMTDGGDMSFCLPDQGVTLSQVREAFLNLMLEEPDRRTEYASVSLLDTLQYAFPCADDEDLVPYVDMASTHPRRKVPGAAFKRAAHRPQQSLAQMLR